MRGSLTATVTEVCEAVGLNQRMLPVSDKASDIVVELVNGQRLVGEWQIIQGQPQYEVNHLFLEPAAAAVLEAIASADALILCSSSLLTGALAVLLHQGLREAIAAMAAPCWYVCSLITQTGQTGGLTVKPYLNWLTPYRGRPVDGMVLNEGELPSELLALYPQQGLEPVVNDLTDFDTRIRLADLVDN